MERGTHQFVFAQVLVAGEDGTECVTAFQRQVQACRLNAARDCLSRQTVARHAAATVWKWMSTASVPGQWTLGDGTVVRYEDIVMLELVQVAKAGHQIILGYVTNQTQTQDVLAAGREVEDVAEQAWAPPDVRAPPALTAPPAFGPDFGFLPPLPPSPLQQPGSEAILDINQDNSGVGVDWSLMIDGLDTGQGLNWMEFAGEVRERRCSASGCETHKVIGSPPALLAGLRDERSI